MEVLGKSAGELRQWMEELGQPAYRGAQVYHALYAERRFSFREMSNLPSALREQLEHEAAISLAPVARRYESADGSVRYLLPLAPSGEVRGAPHAAVEAVFMPSEGRQTICISTQAGCAVDCKFCLTASLGLVRNLTAGEIVGQVLVTMEQNRSRLAPRTNVVLMGQGEPLLNYDAVMDAVRILLDPNALALSPRHVTLSTSGIVPGIERLAQEKLRPRLAISLNASNDRQRDSIMPINRKYSLQALLAACHKYPLRPWERLTFEYVLLGGVNDAPEDARAVVRLLNGIRAKVNLIPWNPGVPGSGMTFRQPEPSRVEEFRRILAAKDLDAFVRYSRGQDIYAACGQLAVIESALPIQSLAGGPIPNAAGLF